MITKGGERLRFWWMSIDFANIHLVFILIDYKQFLYCMHTCMGSLVVGGATI